MKKNHMYAVICLAVMLMGTGCQSSKQAPEVVVPVAPEPAFNEGAQVNNPGSLFAESDVDPLFSDSRARRVGDIVVVNIMESASATNTADTQAEKDGNNAYGVSAFFGQNKMNLLPFANGFSAPVGEGRLSLDTSSISDFEGTGSTSRTNSVIASIAARVIRVMPGGILQIEGVRTTRVNEETQYMVVSGTIRARDISSTNSIMSTQMADANIQYYGQGVLADKQKPGWFTRFMDNLWPF